MKIFKKGFMALMVLVAMLFVFMAAPAFTEQVTITLEWSANTEEFLGGYGAYVSDVAGQYTEANKYADIPAGTETVDYTYDAPDGVATTKYFVVDAHCTVEHHDPILRSGKSNEVNWTYDFAPIVVATNFTAALDGDVITFTWNQEDIERVKKWELYRSEVTGGPYEPFLICEYTGQPGPQYSSVIDMMIPAGELKTYYFVLMTFTPTGVFSVNSTEVNVTIDKREVAPVYNVTIKLKAE